MNVLIRPESADRPDLMNMLQYETTKILTLLHNKGIDLPDNSVKIWIKEFSDTKFFPKIEIDVNGQELQYDLLHSGEIKEAHFKSFIKQGNKTVRHDLDKMSADPLLIKIDNIVRYSNLGN